MQGQLRGLCRGWMARECCWLVNRQRDMWWLRGVGVGVGDEDGVRWSGERWRMRRKRKPSARWDGGGHGHSMGVGVVAGMLVMAVE